jgi:hypothetical protein
MNVMATYADSALYESMLTFLDEEGFVVDKTDAKCRIIVIQNKSKDGATASPAYCSYKRWRYQRAIGGGRHKVSVTALTIYHFRIAALLSSVSALIIWMILFGVSVDGHRGQCVGMY